MGVPCNVLIYGGGAVGSILGWRIAQHSHTLVSVVCRSNFEHVRTAGYFLRTAAWGNGHFVPDRVYQAGRVNEDTSRPKFDYIIFANKTTDGHGLALRDISSFARPSTTLVAAQNGMDVEVPLQKAFPKCVVLSAICNIGCRQIQHGFVEQTASIQRRAFLIGVYGDGGQQTYQGSQARDKLASLDIQFESVDCTLRERWRKLIFNSAWNGVSVLTNLDTHGVLKQPGAVRIVRRIADEANKVALASGVDLNIPDLPESIIDMVRSCAPITPSTLQDARNGRPMELEPIFGYLIAQATRTGVYVPCLSRVTSILQQWNRNSIAEHRLHPSKQYIGAAIGYPAVIDLE